MQRQSNKIRASVVPDVSTKIVNLCLKDDENGIHFSPTLNGFETVESQTEDLLDKSILKPVVSRNEILPIVLRKKRMYDDDIKTDTDSVVNNIEKLSESGYVPINMRKYLLCLQSKAS